jgi:hypothetical protein
LHETGRTDNDIPSLRGGSSKREDDPMHPAKIAGALLATPTRFCMVTEQFIEKYTIGMGTVSPIRAVPNCKLSPKLEAAVRLRS